MNYTNEKLDILFDIFITFMIMMAILISMPAKKSPFPVFDTIHLRR